MKTTTQRIKVIIADDEESLRVSLKNKLNSFFPELEICGEASNGKQALKLIKDHEPDIAFLDIKMPGLSGIEVAQQTGDTCKIVFVTAYDSYAVRAFESNAIDYLLKPISDGRLQQCLLRINKHLSGDDKQIKKINAIFKELSESSHNKNTKLTWINVSIKNITKMISVDDIMFFQAEDRYTIVNTADNNKFLINKPIKELQEELDPNNFWRVHRGTIVNANYIDHVTKDANGNQQIKLKNNACVLKVSRAHSKRFKQI